MQTLRDIFTHCLHPESWQRELLRILWNRRWLMGSVMLINILAPALEPAQSWIAKTALDKFTRTGEVVTRDELLRLVPLAAAVFLGLAAIRLVSHLLDKMLDAWLKIDFQRFYFGQRGDRTLAEDVSRMIYDCEQARKMVDILQRDIWVVVIGLSAVLLWQLQLSSDWVTPLVLASLPTLLVTLLLGPAVRRWSGQRLESVAAISDAVCENSLQRLHEGQTAFYRSSVRFEISKKASEVVAELMLWLGLVVLLLCASFLPVLPERITAGDFAAFAVNLRLLGKPLQELGKLYMKAHECHPAVRRVFVRGLSADAIIASSE